MNKMNLFLLTVMTLLYSANVSAQTFQVNGIYYNVLNASENTVEVARDETYGGDIRIPSNVEYGGASYSVVKIGYKAFYNTRITSVRFPETLKEIDNETFKYCTYLSGISFSSNSLQHIGDNAFEGCASTSFRYLELPEGLLSIGKEAFQDCDNLYQVSCPNSLTTIGESAFSSCDRLVIVNLPGNLSSIPDYMFSACPDLRTCALPKNLKSLGKGAFVNCDHYKTVYLPGTLTNIGENNFNYAQTVYSNIPADKLFEVDETAFYNKKDKTLYVPYGAKTVYENTAGWAGFKDIIEMDNYCLWVGQVGYASSYIDKVVRIPDGVKVYVANNVENSFVALQEVTDMIPAYTGVVIKATEGCYNFEIVETTKNPIAGNLFNGTIVDTWITPSKGMVAFVLSSVDGEVGMYPAKLTDGSFLNNANKAYLLLDNNKLGLSDEELDTSVGGAQLSLRFDFGSATGIDAVQTETEKVIYDLYGRKVKQITGSGLYIIGGKKVYVR